MTVKSIILKVKNHKPLEISIKSSRELYYELSTLLEGYEYKQHGNYEKAIQLKNNSYINITLTSKPWGNIYLYSVAIRVNSYKLDSYNKVILIKTSDNKLIGIQDFMILVKLNYLPKEHIGNYMGIVYNRNTKRYLVDSQPSYHLYLDILESKHTYINKTTYDTVTTSYFEINIE